eukprot:335127-Prymnesium_polylepis.1
MLLVWSYFWQQSAGLLCLSLMNSGLRPAAWRAACGAGGDLAGMGCGENGVSGMMLSGLGRYQGVGGRGGMALCMRGW